MALPVRTLRALLSPGLEFARRRETRLRQAGWVFRLLTARWRRLPDFLIVGAMRCGTTSLYSYLNRHPEILRAERKEVHFFNLDLHFGLGLTWYRGHFPLRRIGITGEATPHYMASANALERMSDIVPRVKLIALLRNPIDRAYSHYHHGRRSGRERRSFEETISEDLTGTRGRPTPRLALGIYVDQLHVVLSLFPREQVLVLKAEDLFSRPDATLGRTLEFLGVRPYDIPRYGRRDDHDYPPLPDTVRQQLVEYFRPHNARLCEYLGRDFGWDK